MNKNQRYCSPNCKPNILSSDDNACYDCANVLNSECYSINNGECEGQSFSSANKIIYNSYPIQCVSSCGPNLFEMGDFCYENCIGGNREVDQASSNKCKCSYLFYRDQEHNKEKLTCFSSGVFCYENTKSYDHDTKECFNDDGCSDEKKKKTIIVNPIRNITRCSSLV